jgi:phage I-like protein
VTDVFNAALTNNPAILDMSPVAQERFARLNARFSTDPGDDEMNPILKALLEGLGLPATDATTEAQATAALASLKTARSDLTALLKSLGVAETTDAATAARRSRR